LPCGPGDVAEDVLIPGDPDRVRLLAPLLSDVQDFGRRREYAVITGRYEGHPLTICSTGIGGPSTEIALVELAGLGARRVIRIGGMSALVPEIPVGSYLCVTSATGGTGVATLYGGTARADTALTAALLRTAKALGHVATEGPVSSTDSYYLGQDRPLTAQGYPEMLRLDSFRDAGSLGVEMECETVLSVAPRVKLIAAALLGVHGNRATNDWLEDYEPTQRNLLHIAGKALKSLSEK
jgi:uridine phosphorylase